MPKNLSERLQVLASRNPDAIRRANLAVFLALKGDIEKAMADGWSARACWEILHSEQRVTFSYQAFCRYVRNHLSPSETADTAPALPPPSAPPAFASPAAPPARTQATTTTSPGTGFNFTAAPNKEELL